MTLKDLRAKIQHYTDKGSAIGVQRYKAVLDYVEANPEEFR